MISIPDEVDCLSRIDREADFKTVWQETASEQDLLSRAFVSGLAADRLSWVFLAAYQSAERKMFAGIPDNEWWSFAASEDRTGQLPPMTLEAGRLNGCKTWVAASDHVDRIIVTANRDCYIVDPCFEGASLESYPPGSFLGDMSIGKLTVKDLEAGEPIVMAGDFGLAEPLYVMAAGCGYLLREAHRLRLDDLPEKIREITSDLSALDGMGHESNISEMLRLYRQIASLGKICAGAASALGDSYAVDWDRNGKLLSMYRRALEKRESKE